MAPIVRLDLPSPLLSRKADYPGSGVSWVGSPDWRQIIALDGSFAPRAEELTNATAFITSAYCFGAMFWRASRVAEADLMVVQETLDGESWLKDHPLSMLLAEPREDISMGELVSVTQMYRDAGGAALWTIDRSARGLPAMLTPFAVNEFRVKSIPPRIYGGYEVRVAGGRWAPKAPEEVVHFRDMNPGSWLTPSSRLDVALQQLNLGHHVNRIVRQLLTKAMFPGGIISADPEWQPTPDEWKAWKAAVEGWSAGPSNQGKPLVVPGGTTVASVARGMADLMPDAVLDRVEATVGSVFGVPPVVLGWLAGLKNSPWSQMADARRQAYEDTIQPLWRDMERRLSRALLSPEERAAGYMVRFDTRQILALKEDEERKARISALNADTWTVDERRVFTGQSPLPEGDERADRIAGLPDPSALVPGLGAGAAGDPSVDPAAAGKSDTKDLLWVLFDAHCKAAEGGWERTIYAHLSEDRADILAAARKFLAAPKADEGKPSPESLAHFHHAVSDILGHSKPRLIAKTYPMVLSTGGSGVRKLGARLGLSFEVLEPGLLKYATEESSFLASVMGETTGRVVSETVQASLNAGETITALVKRLEDSAAFSRDRAKLVARTETTRAWNGAQRRSLSHYERSSGRKALKTWLSSRDERVRDEHVALDDGSELPIDQPFGNGLQEPGEPNCRCTLIYSFADSDSSVGAPP